MLSVVRNAVILGFLLSLLVMACDGPSEAEIEATAEAAPTPTLTATHTPTPIGVPTTTVPAVQTQQSSGSVLRLIISEIAPNIPDYDRGHWKHWIDSDRDCQNTRHEVLIEESLKKPTFKSSKQCQVATGEWLDPYTGLTVTDSIKLDVDHMVPLKNAHDSGGWAWDNRKNPLMQTI